MAALGDLEAVHLLEVAGIGITVKFGGLGRLLVPDITDPLEEEEG